MTVKARLVLEDCKHAIRKHTDELQAEDFRISWFTVVAYLRAVGHVLDKQDVKQSDAMKKAIKQKWGEMIETDPEHQIFFGFIKVERDRFLKEYDHIIERSLQVNVPGLEKPVGVDLANLRGGRVGSPGAEIRSMISTGHYKNRNEVEVAWEAVAWWEKYLDEVDSLAEILGGGGVQNV